MAHPTTSTPVATEEAAGVTSHNLNVGSPSAGQGQCIWLRTNTGPGTVTFTGYTQLFTDGSDASNDDNFFFYRDADGTEGATDTLTTTNVCKIAALAWVISDYELFSVQPPEFSTVAIGTTVANSANPNSVAGTGGSKDYLFLAMMGLDGELNEPTAGPTNYGNFNNANTGTAGTAATNCAVGAASRALTAASDDPGAFTHPAPLTGWTAFTVVVHPAAAVAAASFPYKRRDYELGALMQL